MRFGMMGMGALVSADWLEAALGAPDLRVLDASFYLPTEDADARALFVRAHIPGARFFDIDAVADQDTALPHMLPTPGRFCACVGAMGIGRADRVVVYDQKGIFSAARVWWMFRLFGHRHVAVLDGGLPGWREQARAVEAGDKPPPAAVPYEADFHAARVRGLGDMLDNIRSGREVMLDARPSGRFYGSAPEPRPGLPNGHIPGARSLPAAELLQGGRHMLPPDFLRSRFAGVGVDGRQPVITSCGTGVTAAILTLGLHLAGLPEGALYDGSWTEWAGRPDTPKARGRGG
jgi:thiosulfate/3-mercaptopyruvate sulfurtransferase